MPSFCTKRENPIFANTREPKKMIFVIIADVVMQGVLIGVFDDAESIPGVPE